MLTAILQNGVHPSLAFWMLGGFLLFVVLVGGAYLLSFALRRALRTGEASRDAGEHRPSTENPTAFVTASMQAVIQKLREQEKELAALQKRDRERAEQTERLSEAVTRNMPAGLLLISSAGLVTSANPAAETALGVRALAYRHYTEVFGTDSPLGKLVAACLAEGRTFRREEIEYATPAGELRRLGVTISPILGGGATVTGALCLLSDLTELAALQRQVQLKESLAALGELSAGIAHEFKNALATIAGYAQMIRGETEGDAAENAQRILEQTQALARVVTEFLKFARPLELATDEVAVGPLVERAVAQARDAVPDVEFSVTGRFDTVAGDEALLHQALLNLVLNAGEAARGQPFGGQVRVHGTAGAAAGQRISVSDNGPGIAPGEMAKIFVPFYTTKAHGTGLGLAIVQKIVVQHGGSVEARNRPEGGAEFIVWLPGSRGAAAAVDSLEARA